MSENLTPLFLFTTSLLLGLRHGIDWDHIAAISDITTSTKNYKQAFLLGTTYVLGHGLVVVILGILAISVGIRLPEWVDSTLETIVGLTLILLAAYLALSILKHGKNLHLASRWMLLFATIQNIYNFIESKVTHQHKESHFDYPDNFNVKTALVVGAIHGVGAETPTQLLLFVTAANVGGHFLGNLLVIVFVLGLIISNSLIIAFSIFGISKARENSNIYLFLAGITAIFSFIVGLFFLTGRSTLLPTILGG